MLRLAAALALVVASARANHAQRSPTIVVGANVHVSAAHATDTHYEVLASAHPTDPRRLIVGSLIYSRDGSSAGSIVYSSIDGGVSWTPSLEGRLLERTGDPATAYGPDGTAYYSASLIPSPTAERSMLVFRAPDGGTRWEGPFTATYMDRQYLAVDGAGRIYMNGNNRVPRNAADFVVYSSTDRGTTFVGPGKRAAFARVPVPAMGNAVVTSAGVLVGIFAESDTLTKRVLLKATSSVDSGKSLTAATTISEYVAGGERKGATLGNASAQPMLAIDTSRGPFRDRLYAVWPDRRRGHTQIFFASSRDGGKTWSAARAIDDNPPSDTTDHFMANVAVNRDGVVGIMWYDRRNHPDNLGWDVRFAASLDGGATFAPSVQVSEKGTSFPPGASLMRSRPASVLSAEQASIAAGRESFTYMGGDTAGLTADASGAFHVVWVDNHTGVPQVWAAKVFVRR